MWARAAGRAPAAVNAHLDRRRRDALSGLGERSGHQTVSSRFDGGATKASFVIPIVCLLINEVQDCRINAVLCKLADKVPAAAKLSRIVGVAAFGRDCNVILGNEIVVSTREAGRSRASDPLAIEVVSAPNSQLWFPPR